MNTINNKKLTILITTHYTERQYICLNITLKYLLQQSPLPPWEREVLPMLFVEDQLIAVPHFGIHHAFQAKNQEESYRVSWLK